MTGPWGGQSGAWILKYWQVTDIYHFPKYPNQLYQLCPIQLMDNEGAQAEVWDWPLDASNAKVKNEWS